MDIGIRTGDTRGFNKGLSSKFHVVPRVRQTPEEGREYIGRNVVEITMKMKTIVWKRFMIKIYPKNTLSMKSSVTNFTM